MTDKKRIKRAIALAAEYFSKSAQGKIKDYNEQVDTCTGPGVDFLLTLMRYSRNPNDVTKSDLKEFGVLVTHCIDSVEVTAETFDFPERDWEFTHL